MTDQNYDIVKKIKEQQIDFVEFWFVDVFGELHSLGVPSYSLNEHNLRNGLDKLDSSSIRGFGSVNESDISLIPDTSTFKILPPDYDDTNNRKNARMFVNLYHSESEPDGTHRRYERDSRGICLKAAEEVGKLGLTALWGPEIEFFVFDEIYTSNPEATGSQEFNKSGYKIESEGFFQSGNAVSSPRLKSGYYKAPPLDTLNNLRKDICEKLYRYFDIKIEAHHHEVATAGQCEINIEYGETISVADNVVTIKNLAKVVAKGRNKIATFMPKPIYGDNASAMHMHQSLWTSDERNAMYDPNETKAGLSQLARYYIGGILDHIESLCAISNPATNSYKRLVPGYEAPIYGCWGVGNRSTAIRIPRTDKNNEKRKRLEYRVPDSAANIYLLEAALMMAGLDGIKNKKEPGDPIDENVYKLTPEQKRKLMIKTLPATLKEALDAFQSDNKFLQGTFSKDFLDSYISLKYDEYEEFVQTPTTWEILTYLNV